MVFEMRNGLTCCLNADPDWILPERCATAPNPRYARKRKTAETQIGMSENPVFFLRTRAPTPCYFPVSYIPQPSIHFLGSASAVIMQKASFGTICTLQQTTCFFLILCK